MNSNMFYEIVNNEKTEFRQKMGLIQRLLYMAGGLYSACLDIDGNVIDNFICDNDEEMEILNVIVQDENIKEALIGAENNFLEDVIPIMSNVDYAVCQGVMLKVDGAPRGVFVVVGIIKDYLDSTVSIPDSIKRLSVSEFDDIIKVLKRVTDSFMSEKKYVVESQNEIASFKQTIDKLKYDYSRTALITDIVRLLESDDDLDVIVKTIFMRVCDCFGFDRAMLYRINVDMETVNVFVDWLADDSLGKPKTEERSAIADNPFMKKENYIISSNTSLKPNQKEFLERNGLTAYIVFPIYIRDEICLYLTFSCMKEKRVFSTETIRFVSDIRKIVQSIIVKKVSQNSLASSLTSLEEILEHMGCGVFVIEPSTRRVLFKNRFFNDDVISELYDIKLIDLFQDDEDEVVKEIPNLKMWFKFKLSHINWVDGRKVEMYSVYDVTEVKAYESSLEKSTSSDFLTGLFNKMRCEQDLQVYLNLAKENNGKGALFFIDLDDFKHINEVLGHQYGDILLKAISANLRKIPGIESTCYRVGGDEFIAIVSNNHIDQLVDIINEVEEIFAHPWLLKGTDYYCTMSMGVCMFPSDADTVEDVIRKADIALSSAKRSGKNHVEYYSTDDEVRDLNRINMERFMRDACICPNEEFEVLYQPIIDISGDTEVCMGAEALLRWNSKAMGRINPGDFIPLAEYLGLIKPIGDYVLNEAVKACRHWNEMGHPEYKVNVNFSVVQLLQNNLKERIKEVLGNNNLSPQNLTLEVTESLAINDFTYMKTLLNSIRNIGVRIALDDFGTGYSSLNHIHEMPIDIIKVDRCFINNLGKDEYSEIFVKMVSELATSMKMNVCVEGVENEIQNQIIKKYNVDLIQGFYYAEPMTLEEFERRYID